MLNVNTFKKFCLKAGTKKADEIHDYYIKLEELLQETLNEETHELRLQLQNKEEKLKEETMIRKQFKARYQCFLKRRIDIDNKFEKGELVYLIGCEEIPNKYKLGFTTDLKKRIADYHTELPYEPILFYKKYISNANFVEQVIHHNLRKFRIHNSKEWFQSEDMQVFIKEIDDTVLFFENKDKQYENVVDVKGDINEIFLDTGNNANNEKINKDPELDDEEQPDNITEEEKDENKKKCSRCKLYLLKENFSKNPKRSDGLDNNCKDCCKKKYAEMKNKDKVVFEEKKCTKCNILKDSGEFYNRAGSVDGKSAECKECSIDMYNDRFNKRKDAEAVIVNEKTCKTCSSLLDICNFSKKTDSSDGYENDCKKCKSDKVKKIREIKKDAPEFKNCNQCSKELSIDNFWNNKSNKDGKDNKCKTCSKANRVNNKS